MTHGCAWNTYVSDRQSWALLNYDQRKAFKPAVVSSTVQTCTLPFSESVSIRTHSSYSRETAMQRLIRVKAADTECIYRAFRLLVGRTKWL